MRTFVFVFFPWLLRQEKKTAKKVSFSWCNDDDDDDDDGGVSIDESFDVVAWEPDSVENHFSQSRKASVYLETVFLSFLLFPSHSACHNLVIFSVLKLALFFFFQRTL